VLYGTALRLLHKTYASLIFFIRLYVDTLNQKSDNNFYKIPVYGLITDDNNVLMSIIDSPSFGFWSVQKFRRECSINDSDTSAHEF